MHIYKEQSFDIPELKGLSHKQLEEHLKLYAGYVKHVNLIREKIHELEASDPEKNAYLISELRRRFSFEFDGMRMHEYYFEELEGGKEEAPESSKLVEALTKKYGGYAEWLEHFKKVATTRGVGWAVLYYDPKANQIHSVWVEDHELGVLAGLPILLALDMWEHAFMVDYTPSEKKDYIEAFFNNLNWSVIESRFTTYS
ncbi:MAG: Fe-Mn family superoxide dismutase [Candidatus Paceibacterota bacterium]